MKVLVTFEPKYNGLLADAVWAIESAENRLWFDAHCDQIDKNSAIFSSNSHPVEIIWNVFEHHPTWTEIELVGRNLTNEEVEEIASEAVLLTTKDGVRITRS